MAQALGLALEAGETILVGGEGFGKNLDSDITVELGIPRPIPSPMPPAPSGSRIS